jgi:hypothetical protein
MKVLTVYVCTKFIYLFMLHDTDMREGKLQVKKQKGRERAQS